MSGQASEHPSSMNGAVRRMRTRIRLLAQPESMRSKRGVQLSGGGVYRDCKVADHYALPLPLELLFDAHSPARPRAASNVVHHQFDVGLPQPIV